MYKITEIFYLFHSTESIVTGLNSTDEQTVNQNLKKSDQLIEKISKKTDVIEAEGITTKTGFNKTFINKNESASAAGDSSQDAFMKIMEKDANERYERKKANQKLANEIKEKGNEQFKLKNYQKALDYYTEAIQTIRDNHILYTNRAQVYIIMEKYSEAIADCDWALKVDEKCIKAFIHKGRSLTYLKKFDEALIEFQNAIKCDPKKTDLINGKINS